MVAAESSNKPHIVILSSPGLGHIIPLFQLAKRLVIHHGCHVSFLAITTHSCAAQHRLLHSPDLPSDLQIINLPSADVSSFITADMPVLHQLYIIVHESLKPLRSILLGLMNRRPRPRALIIDIFTTLAFDVCVQIHIPVYLFFTPSLTLFTCSLFLPNLNRPENNMLDQVRNLNIDEYNLFLHQFSRMTMATAIFFNTWVDFEPDQLQAIQKTKLFLEKPIPPIHPIGPLTKETEPEVSDSDEIIINWLNKQPPDSVLFIALGSGGTLTREQLTELALGIEMSRQRFIFVTRKPLNAGAPAAYFNADRTELESDSDGYLPEGFRDRTAEIGLVVPGWAPQVAILSHESTGGFLSHCGWNSTLESLVHGVPIIAWPLYAEQMMNASALTGELRVAVRPAEEGEVIGREEVERVIRMLMEGEEGKIIRKRTKEMKVSAARSLSNGGSSFEELSSVVETWKSIQ
ncbi:UDP-glycosyltransferase 72B1-like [Impatiens glandulifera]|uniref:UDP-glycosyltransferase 72B1-like n=1 Tax=Impatiens glandulifera TaxID=253017 RepID=UPI001FB0FF09|nr:UDP-glycosyltransferase 72B1-like [Impatiens glandulifera]